jgi:MFS family permease
MIRPYLQLLGSEPPILLFGVLCAFLSSPGQTFFIALFVGSFGESVSLSAAQLGSLYLAATLGAASLLPYIGHWIDRIDLRLYSGLVAAALALACFSASAATGPASLFVALLLLRLTGQGLMTHIEVTSVARYFGTRRGTALALTAMGFPLAEAITPALVVLAIGAYGWRTAYATTGTFVLLLALPALIWLISDKRGFSRRPTLQPGLSRPRALDGMRLLVRSRYFWLALPILLFLPLTSTALIFHIEIIGAMKGWSRDLLASAFAGYAAGHAAGLLVSGQLVDRITARLLVPLMNVPLFAGIAILGLFDHAIALFLFLSLLGLSTGAGKTTAGAVWAEVYGVERLGSIRSFAAMLMVAATAGGPAALGLLLDADASIGALTLGLGGIAMAASLLALTGLKPKRSE